MTVSPHISAEVDKIVGTIAQFRHDLHAHPELTWKEEQTADRVLKQLEAIGGLEIERVTPTGVVATLRGGKSTSSSRTVALRADMDALPVTEKTGAAYASRHPGVMHACGHDGHMAVLMGAATVLTKLRDQLEGHVKFIFQPAEEGGAGADALCKAGVLENPKVDAIFGLHGWPEAPLGSVVVKAGPLLASVSEISITLRGKGTHAAFPHLGTDQILIAARIVEGLQVIRAREVHPTEGLVITMSMFHSGTANNVISDTVELGGTLRTLNMQTRDFCARRIQEIAEGIAQTYGAKAQVTIKHGYPVTSNHPQETEFFQRVARDILGPTRVLELERPAMGAEDFSYYLERVPGVFFLLGMSDDRKGGFPPLHHPQYDFQDAALGNGIKLFTHLATRYLAGGLKG